MGDMKRRFPTYGIVGLIIIAAAELLLFRRAWVVPQFFTPIVWTGYILLVDAINYRLRGESLIRSRRREFLVMLPWSVICWGLFELYNLHLRSWIYYGLPQDVPLRSLGYVWSFATVFPAILETADLLQLPFAHVKTKLWRVRPSLLRLLILCGLVFLTAPMLLPPSTARYSIPFIWVGFAFLLEPLNYILGGRSVFNYLEKGEMKQLLGLLSAGLVCGLLWEFWNYWAEARWVYDLPFTWAGPKVFEMPLLGFLGFLPFAVECHAMQNHLMLYLDRKTSPDLITP